MHPDTQTVASELITREAKASADRTKEELAQPDKVEDLEKLKELLQKAQPNEPSC